MLHHRISFARPLRTVRLLAATGAIALLAACSTLDRGQPPQLERKAAEPSFWDDMENSQKVLQRTAQLKASVETYNKLQALYEDTLTLIELAEEAGDESVYEEAAADTEQLQTRMAEVRLTTLLTGEYDSKNAILTFHAGAGGTEAQDWAQMLYRMYTRWAERHGYSYKILDYLDGDEAGVKSVFEATHELS